MYPIQLCCSLALLTLSLAVCADATQDNQGLPPATFIADFNSSADAYFAKGDSTIFTAPSMQAIDEAVPGILMDTVSWEKDAGRTGGALVFSGASEQVLLFKGKDNIAYAAQGFAGSVSVWMKLNPDELPEGFVDPLMITDKAWNDASFFIDFDKEPERDFRLGTFSDYEYWNPQDTPFDELPEQAKPLYTASNVEFSTETWTHVVITWQDMNTEAPATVRMYIDGNLSVENTQAYQFSWQEDKLNIILGLNFKGFIDDLLVFGEALNESEVRQIFLNKAI